jgi:hypothetical protein
MTFDGLSFPGTEETAASLFCSLDHPPFGGEPRRAAWEAFRDAWGPALRTIFRGNTMTPATNRSPHPTILLVDDDELSRGVMAWGLQGHGYRVIAAADGAAAWALLQG